MRSLISILTISVLGFLGCATQYELALTNSYPQSVKIELDAQGKKDSISVPAKGLQSTVSPVLKISSSTDDLELRTFVVRDSSQRTLSILRFSGSYLSSQDWVLSVPFQAIDTIPPRSLTGLAILELGKTYKLFHIAQEYYNSAQYAKCLALIEGAFQTGAMDILARRASQSIYETEYQEEVSKFAGYCMLGYLSSKKLNRPDKADYYWKSFEQLAPDYSRYLKANDHEFSK